jgi:hypothetical protein
LTKPGTISASSAATRLRRALALLAAALTTAVSAHEPLPLRVEHRASLRDLPQPAKTTHTLELRAVNLAAWPDDTVRPALQQTALILAQCGVAISRVDLLQVTAPESHRYFDTPRSRELARALDLPRPAVFFAAGTRQQPAFDAEAIGRGNSRTRPELADTVWIAQGARDLGIVVAHELAHVLMDSGGHDNTPGNLMAESTTPQNTQLTAAQCERLTATGQRHGLLRGVD